MAENNIVPIRYVEGLDDNIVPVKTVGVGGIGIVPCRAFVGPGHVVPVREVISEVPRVLIVIIP
jgi:hypothetical protein